MTKVHLNQAQQGELVNRPALDNGSGLLLWLAWSSSRDNAGPLTDQVNITLTGDITLTGGGGDSTGCPMVQSEHTDTCF